MLQIIKVIDSKSSPVLGQIWERENAYYLLNSISDEVLWAYKFSNGEVTETAIDLKNSWRFKLFKGSSEVRDQIIDAMSDALYEQDDMENSDRIYELSRLNRS
jgi:hypothetical protein